MTIFDTKSYDDPRRWIQKRNEKGIAWDEIRKGLKQTEEELKQFLNMRVEEDDWPSMTPQVWRELVDDCEKVEARQQPVKFRGNEGALFDKHQDNGLSIPQDKYSSWQLYKTSLLNKGFKDNSVKDIEDATIGILRRLSDDTSETGPIKGLVIGHVQSGKTSNMEALMAMAADHGWNFFVVLSGSIESLRKQTLDRMVKDLNDNCGGNLIWDYIEHPSKQSSSGSKAVDKHFEPGAVQRYFTVCLKHSGRLKKLIDWIHEDNNSHKQMKMLIIDDEADQAGISNTAVKYETKEEEKERKGVNKLIVNLVNDEHYQKSKRSDQAAHAKAVNYVMYTATPYANILNESSKESLYPSNFIWTLKATNEYIGPDEIFKTLEEDDNDGLDIKRIVDDKDLSDIEQIYEGNSKELPNGLKDAISWFICASCVWRYWHRSKPVSMLVHTSQKQLMHHQVASAIEDYINNIDINELMDRCEKVYSYETTRLTKDRWIQQFSNYGDKDKIRDYPSFKEIKPFIEELLSVKMQHIKMDEEGDLHYSKGLHLVIDNCANNRVTSENDHIRLAYPDPNKDPYPSPAPTFIIIGGSTLSRGLTLEGLVSTFFLRASCQVDSLMQMGRWFGYRKGYELLPRIWITEDTLNKFRFMTLLESDLREDLKKYMYSEITPSDYGPRMLNSPKYSWLRLTSRKHMTNAEKAEMDFTGAKPQTVLFDNDVTTQTNNIKVTEDFISKLKSSPKISVEGTSLFWENVPLSLIESELLVKKFKFCDRARAFNEIESFISWIEGMKDNKNLNSWNVIVAGNGKVSTNLKCDDDQYWIVDGYKLKKVVRSRRANSGYESENIIDIGALRKLKDHLADVPEKYIHDFNNIKKQDQIDQIRRNANLDSVPMLLIYRIYAKSEARKDSPSRKDLNMPCDIIGLQIVVPGDNTNSNGYARKITVHLVEDKDQENEVEDK